MLKASTATMESRDKTKNTPAKRGPATRWIAIPNSLLRPLIAKVCNANTISVGADLDVALIRAVDVSNGQPAQRDQEADAPHLPIMKVESWKLQEDAAAATVSDAAGMSTSTESGESRSAECG